MDPQCHHRREPLIAAPPAPVPPLSAYVAKRCPRRVQLDLVEPAVPLEPTADVQMRLDEGVAFEASVVAELRAVAGSDWVFVDQTASPGLQVEATTPAIAAEVAVVVGARLPNDAAAARSGAPDVLVCDRGGYVAVDVKHHRSINTGDAVLLTSTLAVPTPSAAASRRWLGAASRQGRRAAARPLPLHASGAWLGRIDLSGGHHRQGTACGLVRPRQGDVEPPPPMLAYCWHQAAENTQLRRITRHSPTLKSRVDSFISSGEWVDLERIFKAGMSSLSPTAD